jgi:hypothetical protein
MSALHSGRLPRFTLLIALVALATIFFLVAPLQAHKAYASTTGGCTSGTYWTACVGVDSSGTKIIGSATIVNTSALCGVRINLYEDEAGNSASSYDNVFSCNAAGTITLPSVALVPGHTWYVDATGALPGTWSPYYGQYSTTDSPVLNT